MAADILSGTHAADRPQRFDSLTDQQHRIVGAAQVLTCSGLGRVLRLQPRDDLGILALQAFDRVGLCGVGGAESGDLPQHRLHVLIERRRWVEASGAGVVAGVAPTAEAGVWVRHRALPSEFSADACETPKTPTATPAWP